MKKIIVLHVKDNVATALVDLKLDEVVVVRDENITLKTDIDFEHKFALEDIDKGTEVTKYGISIGVAYKDIKKGEHVHMQNLRSLQDESDEDKDDWSNRIV